MLGGTGRQRLRVRRVKLALYCSLVPQACWVSLELTERVRVVGP
jgi:hypothetical protein